MGAVGFLVPKTGKTDAYVSANTPLCVDQHMPVCWYRHACVSYYHAKSLQKGINNDHFTNLVNTDFLIWSCKGASEHFIQLITE
jgi:hypothetical protein